MKIQRRLTLGIGILFAMIVLLGIQSVSYVRQLSRATGTILADNYNSLQYAADMLRSLNDIGEDSVSRHALRQSLALQQQNITEISERCGFESLSTFHRVFRKHCFVSPGVYRKNQI